LYLLDVNILVAIQWEQDEAHELAFEWFEKTGIHSFATCSLTQTSLLRLMMTPGFPGKKASVGEAREILRLFTQLDGHTFWSAAPAYEETVAPFGRNILGHRQITDGYLLGLAIRENAALVTRDRGILHLAGSEYQKHVVII
jgi:hypothetical protein